MVGTKNTMALLWLDITIMKVVACITASMKIWSKSEVVEAVIITCNYFTQFVDMGHTYLEMDMLSLV